MLSQMHAHLRAHAVAASAAAFTARRGVPQRRWAPHPSLSRPARRLAGARSRGNVSVSVAAQWVLIPIGTGDCAHLDAPVSLPPTIVLGNDKLVLGRDVSATVNFALSVPTGACGRATTHAVWGARFGPSCHQPPRAVGCPGLRPTARRTLKASPQAEMRGPGPAALPFSKPRLTRPATSISDTVVHPFHLLSRVCCLTQCLGRTR